MVSEVDSLVCGLICGLRLIVWIKIEAFTGTTTKLSYSNNSIWKPKIEDILYCKDMYNSIKLRTFKPIGKSYDNWEKMHWKTIGTIRK